MVWEGGTVRIGTSERRFLVSRDLFEQEGSGGGFPPFTFEVTGAYFATDEKYAAASGGSPVYFLHWVGTTDIPDRPTMGPDEFHPKWSCHADLVSEDGGKTVIKVDPNKKLDGGLGKAAGRMVKAAAEVTKHLANTPDDPFGAEGADPQIAETWVGLKWRMEQKTYTWKIGGEERSTEEFTPVEYLGRIGTSTPTPVTAVAAPAASSNGSLRDQVVALAAQFNDHGEFTRAALVVPGVASQGDLVKEILDATAIWAEAH